MTTPPPPPGMSTANAPAPSSTVSVATRTQPVENVHVTAKPDETFEASGHVTETTDSPQTRSNPTKPVEPARSVLDPRVNLLKGAATWYVENLGVTVVPGHYPVGDDSENLRCSCGNEECDSSAKHPAVSSYKRTSNHVNTAEAAATVWAENPWNIFVLVGQSQGLLVFDIDPRHGGGDSFEILKANLDGVLDFDSTYHYSTSSGGSHYYFKVNKDDHELWAMLKRIPFRIMPGIEFKRAFGYVVAAPSRHISGDFYTRPSDSPLSITELVKSDVQSLVAKYRGVSKSAVASTGHSSTDTGSWAGLAAANDREMSDVGVAFGGSAGYEDVVQQVIDQIPGAPARLVSYFWIHGELPGATKIASGSGLRNIVLSNVIRRMAELYFSHPKAQTELRFILEQAGADLRQSRSCPVPAAYFLMATSLDKLLCEEPYAVTKPNKFREIVSSSMVAALTQIESEGY